MARNVMPSRIDANKQHLLQSFGQTTHFRLSTCVAKVPRGVLFLTVASLMFPRQGVENSYLAGRIAVTVHKHTFRGWTFEQKSYLHANVVVSVYNQDLDIRLIQKIG